MRKTLFPGPLIVLAALVFGQSASGKYEPGTILVIEPHNSTTFLGSPPPAYGISIPVSNTVYRVLYMPPPDKYGVEYCEGTELLVLVRSNPITYNDILGRSRQSSNIAPTTGEQERSVI